MSSIHSDDDNEFFFVLNEHSLSDVFGLENLFLVPAENEWLPADFDVFETPDKVAKVRGQKSVVANAGSADPDNAEMANFRTVSFFYL